MLAEDLMALASLAGQAVVASAVTDAWGVAKDAFVQLFGRGDLGRAKLAERRLAETQEQLTGAVGADLERVRDVQAGRWSARLADLLEEDPGIASEIRALLQQIQAGMPAGMLSVADHSVAAGRDLRISAISGGVAVGVIHGNMAPPNPTSPGPEAS